MAEVILENLETSLEHLKNVFNMDEIGLYYRMMPSKSISAELPKGFKNFLARITLAFTVSAEGEKLKPLLIGNAARHRALINL